MNITGTDRLPAIAFLAEAEVCRRVADEFGENARTEMPLYYKDGRPAGKRADILINTPEGIICLECKSLKKSTRSGGITAQLAAAYHEAMLYRDMGAQCFQTQSGRLRQIKYFGGFVSPFFDVDDDSNVKAVMFAHRVFAGRFGLVTPQRVETWGNGITYRFHVGHTLVAEAAVREPETATWMDGAA